MVMDILQGEIKQLEQQLEQKKAQLSEFIQYGKNIGKHKWEFPPTMSVNKFREDYFTKDELEYIVAYVHGSDVAYKLRYAAIIQKEGGDITYSALLREHIILHACKKCDEIGHTKQKCPILLQIVCDVCQKRGHSVDKCKDLDALRKYALSKKQ